jgi:hypothetical protein
MSGSWFDVIIAGKHLGVSGTSAATPVVAGIIYIYIYIN